MSLVNVKVIGLVQGTSEGNYSLLLEELNGKRRLPILIGSYEAQSIALAMEKTKVKRPFTHDLMVQFIEASNITINAVRIHSLNEGVFLANLIYFLEDEEQTMPCRPSDGVAIALRLDFGIEVEKHLIDEYGILMNDEVLSGEEDGEQPGRSKEDVHQPISKSFEDLLKDYTMQQLEKILEDAEQNEDYEKAVLIRDEINKRS